MMTVSIGNAETPRDRPLAEEHQESSRHQEHTADARALQTKRRQFFKCDECRQRRNDDQVHHTADKQEQHQHPAAPETVAPVPQPHLEGPAQPFTPVRQHEVER